MDLANIQQRTKYDPFMENYQAGGTAQNYASLGSGIGSFFGGSDSAVEARKGFGFG